MSSLENKKKLLLSTHCPAVDRTADHVMLSWMKFYFVEIHGATVLQ